MKVLKFGGTSVGSAERFSSVAGIIAETLESSPAAIVVSAVGGVTNQLISCAQEAARGRKSYEVQVKNLAEQHREIIRGVIPPQNQSSLGVTFTLWMNELEDVLRGIFLIRELSKRTLDYVMSFGERFSTLILTEILNARGIPSEFVDARTIIRTDSDFGNAHVESAATCDLINRHFAGKKALQVITGFVGSTAENETTTLGRGGSDLTASLIGAAIGADEVEIWTDVDGIMTADPKKVREAFSLPSVTYEEAMELSHFGAKVIYPPTMQPAMDKNIPIRVKNSFNTAFGGTVIGPQIRANSKPVTGVSSIRSITLLQVRGSGMIGVAGVSGRLFGALSRHQISVILITQASSEHTICLAVNPVEAPKAKQVIEQEFAHEMALHLIKEVEMETDLSAVSVVGENMRKTPGISGTLFSALGRNGINIVAIAQGSSERNISVIVSRDDEDKALNALHDRFFLSDRTRLNVFLVGIGLIGTTLLTQIREQSRRLLREQGLDIRLVGLSNSKTMFFDEEGINFQTWTLALASSPRKADLDLFLEEMQRLNLPNSVFVDCTASDTVASRYAQILNCSIAVVTPNKKAQSGRLGAFELARRTARKRHVPFLYEASVGAGLPVIGTLNDLLVSGDEILQIDAVLSGTLSFIFNSFDGSKSFSAVIAEARERGLTEPDPRDDLSGRDVGRKIVTLGREMGLKLELEDVPVETLVPEDCTHVKDVDEFLVRLKEHDQQFEEQRRTAAELGEKLRYVATLADGRAVVKLQSVPAAHPFANLSGSDNMIVITSKRYRERPLVVQGPGAGAEVTAAGVFADLIRVGNAYAQKL